MIQVAQKVLPECGIPISSLSDFLFLHWSYHWPLRIQGGAAGTNLEKAQCPSGSDNTACTGAFLGLHLTRSSSAYLEVSPAIILMNPLLKNFQSTWVWTADHDIDGDGSSQLTIFTGRGILSQSAGPVWLIGTACQCSIPVQLLRVLNHPSSWTFYNIPVQSRWGPESLHRHGSNRNGKSTIAMTCTRLTNYRSTSPTINLRLRRRHRSVSIAHTRTHHSLAETMPRGQWIFNHRPILSSSEEVSTISFK